MLINLSAFVILIVTITQAYEGLPKAKEICERINVFANTQKDTRLIAAFERHCKKQKEPQLSGLIGAFYHMEIDLHGKDPKKAAFYRKMLSEIATFTQTYPDFRTPPKKWELQKSITELSGFAFNPTINELWFHGDSGNGPYVGYINTKTVEAHRIKLSKATNVDWEAIAFDDKSNLWILDVGDNRKTRKQVSLYKILNKDLHGSAITPEKFDLVYLEGPMDCEAGIIHNNVLYLFEKIYYLEPRVYAVNLAQSPLEAKLIGRLPISPLITDASITADGKLFFLGYTGILQLENWPNLMQAKFKSLTNNQLGQTESLIALNEHLFWVGREDGSVFEITIP